MAICGIDLGTTNSLIAVFDGDKPRLIPNALGEVLTPSVVGVDDRGEIVTGKPARERLLLKPDATVATFKRLMGTESVTRLGRHQFRPEELSALILRALKDDAEAHLGRPIEDAIISVPAYFNDHQRKATLDAGRLAGLKVERLVNEPTAAALAYGLGVAEEGKFLVFDLGGGTFDVSILDKYEGVMEVRATAGDTHLGGEDFTALLEDLMLRGDGPTRQSLTPTDAARLRRTAETVKFALTREHRAAFEVVLGGKPVSGSVARDEFDEAAASLLRRLRGPLERAIGDATLKPDDLDRIILVGGATRMPMIRSLVARLFGRLPLANIDPDETVALGAAVQAGMKQRMAVLEDVVMTDVCPFTLGIAASDGLAGSARHVAPIIERNAVVPISRSQYFSTLQNAQSVIAVEVYQGENLHPENNVKLGEFDIKVPKNRAGAESIEVRFTYDINGAVEVEATVVSTGLRMSRIFRNLSGLTEEDLQRRFASLEELKLLPREQAKNRLLIERAERLYAEVSLNKRDVLRRAIGEFVEAINDQQEKDIEAIRSSFATFLDGLER